MYIEIVKVDIGIKLELDTWTWNAIPSLIQNYLDNENLFWFSISDKINNNIAYTGVKKG